MNLAMVYRSVSTPDEIAVVASLAAEIWREYFPSVISGEQIEYMLEKYQSRRAIAEQIAAQSLAYHLMVDDDPCGYYAMRAADNGVFLSKLYVRKDRRGRGFARAAVDRAAATARELPEKRIWLTCNKRNDAALAAYQHMGFSNVDAVVTDIGGGYVMDDYILEKRVS